MFKIEFAKIKVDVPTNVTDANGAPHVEEGDIMVGKIVWITEDVSVTVASSTHAGYKEPDENRVRRLSDYLLSMMREAMDKIEEGIDDALTERSKSKPSLELVSDPPPQSKQR